MHARLQQNTGVGALDPSKTLQSGAEASDAQLAQHLGQLGPTALGGVVANRDVKQRGQAMGIALALLNTRSDSIKKVNQSLAKA